mgnify:CR=1 FL=1
MSNIPNELRYTAEHEWVQQTGPSTVRFGITDFAQAALGDIVFVTLPAANTDIVAGEACGEVESTKSVSDIFAPVAGKVVAVNDAVETNPDTLNSDPYGAGWIAEVEVGDAAAALSSLLTAAGYAEITAA